MIESTIESISNPLEMYWNGFVAFLPQLFGAAVVLVIGLVIASIIASVIRKLIELAEQNKQTKDFLNKWNINLNISGFVGKFVWWVVFLVFLSASVQILKIQVLTETINSLVGYLPSIFAAVVIGVAVLFGAQVLRNLVVSALEGIGFAKARLVGVAVYTVVLIFGLTLAASQLGLDTTVVTSNLNIIVGGIMLAFALAFGLGGREVAGRAVEDFYKSVRSNDRVNKDK